MFELKKVFDLINAHINYIADQQKLNGGDISDKQQQALIHYARLLNTKDKKDDQEIAELTDEELNKRLLEVIKNV